MVTATINVLVPPVMGGGGNSFGGTGSSSNSSDSSSSENSSSESSSDSAGSSTDGDASESSDAAADSDSESSEETVLAAPPVTRETSSDARQKHTASGSPSSGDHAISSANSVQSTSFSFGDDRGNRTSAARRMRRDRKASAVATYNRTVDAASSPTVTHAIRNHIDGLREGQEEKQSQQQLVSGVTEVVSGAASIGYLFGSIRGGLLMASLASSMPAFQVLDPLPVWDGYEFGGEDEEGESLQSRWRNRTGKHGKVSMTGIPRT